jgi:glycosyltransferase involved in cell wall biosynthesis
LKVLALTRYTRLGSSSRLRFYQYEAVLKDFGIDVEVSPLLSYHYLYCFNNQASTAWASVFSGYLQRLIQLFAAKKFDILWIEKELFPNFPAWFEQALVRLGIHYIVDYDDATFHNYDLSNAALKKLLSNKIDRVMANSALVVCGNQYLAEHANAAGAKRVEILPTVIDLNRYTVAPTKTESKLIIGWMGSPSTAKYLEQVVPALQIIAKEFAVQLQVIGANFTAADLDIDCQPWSEDCEVSAIQNFDIGIMPLLDAPWEKGKCGYKLIQYMACAKPVIASPIGVNQEIVKQGINGYLAVSVDEWVQAFRSLCVNQQSRLTMGKAGRDLVEKQYCLQVTAPRLAQMFYDIAQ